jgi:Co/Zn/Cd efflux system component
VTLRSLIRMLLRSDVLLRIASIAALLGIALMVWSLFDPTVVSVMIAMMIGQGLGTLSLLAFLLVMARDLRHALRNPTEAEDPPAVEE